MLEGKKNKKRKSSVNFLFFMFRGHFEALASTLKANDFAFNENSSIARADSIHIAVLAVYDWCLF